jgi:protoporphyrinogen oxidase
LKNIIIGAGLAGLSAAYHLGDDYLILEKENRVGGLCRTEFIDGFGFDYAIHILYSSDPYATELIQNKLLKDNLIVQPRSSWIFSKGTYTHYPFQANTYGLPAETVKECLLGVIKATYENSELNPKNFEEWIYATFGEGIAKHFMIPYNRKQWAIDLKRMTDAWIRDRALTPSLDEVIEGALTDQKKGFGPNAVFWYPEEGGIEALPKGFLKYIDKKNIKLNTPVSKIKWKEKRLYTGRGKEYGYEKLISSLPLPYLVKLMEPAIPADINKAVGRLEYNTIYAVNLAVKREKISDYHWVYFAEEKYLLHRISFPMNFSFSMVPQGWSSITVEIAASKYKKIPKGGTLVKKAIKDLKDANIIKNNDIVKLKSVLILKPAYVIYTHTHKEDVNRLHQSLNENNIFPCGRFGEWEYLNMDHSILSGEKAAERIKDGR